MIKLQYNVDLQNFATIQKATAAGALGITLIELHEEYLLAKMPVDERTHQPMGFLHGGASALLAETLGSFGSNAIIDTATQQAMGTEISASHLRSVRSGFVYAKAMLQHKGKTSHVWQIEITDDNQNLICISRLTTRILARISS